MTVIYWPGVSELHKLLHRYAAALLAVTIGVFSGSAAFVMYYGEGFSYLSSDPRACVNCHIMREQYDGWQKASHHAAATCVDCHLPHAFVPKYLAKMENGYKHSKAFTFQDFHEPIHIHEKNSRVLQANCVRCHGEFVHPILDHTGTDQTGSQCVRCHAGVGHGTVR
jgi:cytochrome c nitrite reductase small subunit